MRLHQRRLVAFVLGLRAPLPVVTPLPRVELQP
jgi:hypothetical protein